MVGNFVMFIFLNSVIGCKLVKFKFIEVSCYVVFWDRFIFLEFDFIYSRDRIEFF